MPDKPTTVCVTVAQDSPVTILVPGRDIPIVVRAAYKDGRIRVAVTAEKSIAVRREGYEASPRKETT